MGGSVLKQVGSVLNHARFACSRRCFERFPEKVYNR